MKIILLNLSLILFIKESTGTEGISKEVDGKK